MKMFIWDRVKRVTSNWHSEGGVVVLADSLETARDLIKKRQEEDRECEAMTKEPDRVFVLAEGYEPQIMVFPDSGCC